jgi:S-adenosylmethionine-diacylgycerolhomoserine-N-methlytransferase
MKVLYHLALKPVRGKDHAERMESFYAGQADAYDGFRRRLLQGRETLFQRLEVPPAGIWVDLGGGTGSNVEYLSGKIDQLKAAYIVDLSASLLEVASERFRSHGWSHVEACAADATTYQPPEPVDLVTFSYSLTMIPDWFSAIENAARMLRPGGQIGVVDFYVSRKYPAKTVEKRHSWFTRHFWPAWFGCDNVFPSADHLPFLQSHFETEYLEERMGKIPYLPFIRAPHYVFVGRKRSG